MAKRNILKIAESGHNVLAPQRELMLGDVWTIWEQENRDFLQKLSDFFYLGVALGYRQAQADAKRCRQ